MEVDLKSLFGLYVTWCAQLYSLPETPQPPPPAFGLVLRGRYWSAKIGDIWGVVLSQEYPFLLLCNEDCWEYRLIFRIISAFSRLLSKIAAWCMFTILLKNRRKKFIKEYKLGVSPLTTVTSTYWRWTISDPLWFFLPSKCLKTTYVPPLSISWDELCNSPQICKRRHLETYLQTYFRETHPTPPAPSS